MQLHFTKEVLPDSVSSDFQNLSKLNEQQFHRLIELLFQFLLEPKEWGEHHAALSRLAVRQTLMVNQLVDMEWKFGVTVGTSEIQKVGNIFLQLKLVVRRGNSTENVYMGRVVCAPVSPKRRRTTENDDDDDEAETRRATNSWVFVVVKVFVGESGPMGNGQENPYGTDSKHQSHVLVHEQRCVIVTVCPVLNVQAGRPHSPVTSRQGIIGSHASPVGCIHEEEAVAIGTVRTKCLIMTTRRAGGVADTVTSSTTTSSSSSSATNHHQNQQRSRSPGGAAAPPASEAAAAATGGGGGGGAEMFGEFQGWCLRTYGDSGKTKTVTRRKYNKILQTLLQGDEENSNGLFLHEKSGGHINAKFKFWVKSKGFQVGTLPEGRNGSSDRPVLYVPIKATSKGFQVGTLPEGRNGSSDRPVLYVPIKATLPPVKTEEADTCGRSRQSSAGRLPHRDFCSAIFTLMMYPVERNNCFTHTYTQREREKQMSDDIPERRDTSSDIVLHVLIAVAGFRLVAMSSVLGTHPVLVRQPLVVYSELIRENKP
ncbi:hypothetical protein F2P81_011337 [Scophthalmus maximus]|uniref:COMM domain-containing protein n=1 Tax=Scophthalmus maximus TaxID=52904 RepID=A0A6A4STM3_SCOMX|nr:hypothetical protein F2P81_011337 [Scophthalmus maximus]